MALHFGADAVYLAGAQFGMRAGAENFTPDGIRAAVQLAHAQGAAVHVTCNTLPRDDEMAQLPAYLELLDDAGVDAIIAADLGVITLAKRYAPDVALHVSTQFGVVNSAAAAALYDLGAQRVVLARELSLAEIAAIRAHTPPELELEAFVHGAMCVSFSGRCLLSNYLTGRDANRGRCAQPCRQSYGYTHWQEKYPLSLKDNCLIPYLRELQDTSTGQLQIISPYRTDGEASSNGLNALIRETVNPHTEKIPELAFGERIFRLHDRVMQTKNNYNLEGYDSACGQKFKGVFNGDIGSICKILPDKLCVDFDGRIVEYSKTQLGDLELAYAITIHKSMGSEYETVIIPMLMAHRILLTKNLIYTAVTRAKKRVILVGQKRALFLAIHSGRKLKRNTCLAERIIKYNQVFRQKALPQGATEQKLKKAG